MHWYYRRCSGSPFFEYVLVSPVRASIKSVGGLCCRWGCLGVGSSTRLEVLGIMFCWLSVRFRFRNSFDSLLSLRLSLSFLASSSTFFDRSFHYFISSSLVVPFSLVRYSVISCFIFSRVSCSCLITFA